MAHAAKYTQNQVGHLINHYNRSKEKDCERSNKNIDKDLTSKNYNLMEREQTPQDYYNDRLNDVWHIQRADINTMCSWVITLPEKWQGDERPFFNECVSFLNDRYGRDNCIGAWVHMDETTPHLHYAFLPVVPDKNPKHDKDIKLNAKKVISRTELQHFHKDLQEHLRERFPDRDKEQIKVYGIEQDRKKDRLLRDYQALREDQRLDRIEEQLKKREIDIQARERDIENRLNVDRSYRDYFKEVDRYIDDHGLTFAQYERERFMADFKKSTPPEPERLNPERTPNERKEIERYYNEEHTHEHEHTHNREHNHEPKR